MAKRTKIVVKPVSFNEMDPDQKADLDFVNERSNFSGFVRTLIRMERLRQSGQLTNVPATLQLPKVEKPKNENYNEFI